MAKGRCVISLQHAVIGVLSLVLLMQRGEATTFVVGGTKGWTVPPNNSPVFNQWAEKMRFQLGDSLLFVYHPANDSVLRVTKENYDSCNTTSPLEKYTDGHTEIKFNQSGPYYFISGNKDDCLKNEKLVVVVLADRTKKASSPPSPPPSSTPAPAPTTASPPAPSTDEGGAAAPSAESHPPKSVAAPSMLGLSFVGSLGAFVGSTLLLGF
ncbi:hypothetical protein Cgig2_013264 [Carnegiea gigantea]|uniref:Phytocyanin domain-containing protein n=1 Tax=Carnegiea gigantea TaxID=171969 RepID=A0A9Q1K3W4_9CARY|nr:hypothetical protein Cgig2_013264 [Carnegiea gigantea]